jgi:hypothetical protein
MSELSQWNQADLSKWGFDFEFNEFEEPCTVQIKPYDLVHVLISFPPELFGKIQDSLNLIKQTEGILYEESAN